jgi:hypothetical protein
MGPINGADDLLSFESKNNGMKIFDNIENHQCEINTPEVVTIEEESTERFVFPVDRASSIITEEISINHTIAVCVRNHAGVMIEEFTMGDTQTFPNDQYILEFSSPIKLYILVNSNINIEVKSNKVNISFEAPQKVYVGVRSHHERPSTTISTTDDPKDLVRAISYFGSALKTTSCERSYPTLRGYPPSLSLNDELKVPKILEKPETDVTIEVPPNYQSIFVIAPLAYYFGADVRLSETAMITAEGDIIHNLEGTTREFEDEVERVLKQCFFLDCISRTEGYYEVRLYEREQIESKLGLEFDLLYDMSISEQIQSYLSIPYEKISGLLPTWKKTAHVEPKSRNIKFLSHLSNDLSIIKSEKRENIENKTSSNGSGKSIKRIDSENDSGRFSRGELNPAEHYRSDENVDIPQKNIEISESTATEHTWVGHGMPIGASKATLDAFENRLNQTPTDGDIDIAIVVNDEEMAKEGTIVDDVYSSRDQLSLTTELQHQLTTGELHKLLNQEYDFLHYIGHIDKTGFRCIDGQLDATNVENVRISTFFLNACTSYQQATELIKSGAVAGIATTNPVLNSGAERVGKTVARLLNLGFPIISALKIAKSESIMGSNYTVIGDGSTNLTQAQSGVPSLCEINKESQGRYKTTYLTYPTRRRDLGTITVPYAKNNKTYFLTSGETGEFKMDKNELIRFTSMGTMPVRIDSELYWGNENDFITRLN